MKLKLNKQDIIPHITIANGDIDPTNNAPITSKNLNQILKKKPGYAWFIELHKLQKSFSQYKDYEFYEKSMQDIVVSSLNLEKHNDGSASIQYKNIDDLSQALQSGHEWLTANKDAILKDLENKEKQEHIKLRQDLLSLIDQEVSDHDDQSNTDDETMMHLK